MKNEFHVKGIKKKAGMIEYDYEIQGEWETYFSMENMFWVRYEEDITKVPDSVAVLPLLGNILVLASILDACIYVNSVDEDFLKAVPGIINGYQNMLPGVCFHVENLIHADQVVKSENDGSGGRMLYFSGGVDACSSFIAHESEDLSLILIGGADIATDNDAAWKKVCDESKSMAEDHGHPFSTISSSFRAFIRNDRLDAWCLELCGDGYWHALQHSLGMMVLSAPLAYLKKYDRLYFAATFCEDDPKGYICASIPDIDNNVRFSGCSVLHDGFEYGRYEKIQRICRYSRENRQLVLRVCYRSEAGDNCCVCGKCALTIFGILLEGCKPENFGFHYDKEKLPGLVAAGMQEYAHEHPLFFKRLAGGMQKKYRECCRPDEVPKELRAFYQLELDDFVAFMSVPNNLALEKEKSIVCLEKHVEDMNGWIEELEEGKNWLEKHVKELEDWIQELERGKNWLESQWLCCREKLEKSEAK